MNPSRSGMSDTAALAEENRRLLDELEWAYAEVAGVNERVHEESQILYAEVRGTVGRLERRVAELSTLNDMARALGAALRLDQVIEIVAQRLRATLPGTLFAVAVAPRDEAPAELAIVCGETAEAPGGRAAAAPAARRAMEERRTIRVDDAAAEAPGAGLPPGGPGPGGCRSWLSAPLFAGDQVAGALVAAHSEPGTFQADDERLLDTMAIQAAAAVGNARLYEAMVRRSAELAAVLEMSCAISSPTTGARALLEPLARRAGDLIEGDSVAIFLFEETRETLAPIIYLGSEAEAVMKIRCRPGEGIVGLVAQTGQPQLVNHAESDPRAVHIPGTSMIRESILCAPLIARETTLGVLTLSREEEREFRREDLEFLMVVAAHAAIALENARLMESSKRAYEDLKAAQDQLVVSERLHALGEMASGVAHDFNNMLGAILGRAQLLLMRNTDPGAVKGLRLIEQAARDGAHTVKRIQDFTRLSAPAEPVPVDVNHVARDAVEFTRPRWERPEGAGEITVDLEPSATDGILANAADLREVLTNLLINAVDASPLGGRIVVRTRSLDGRVEVSVADSGAGMPPEMVEKIFKPFFTTKGRRGTGLGLAVSQGLVARHNGHVSVATEVGKGSTFTLSFPAHAGMEAARAGATARPPAAEKGAADGEAAVDARGVIMVVDDDPEVAEVLAEALRAAGHSVHIAPDAARALDLYASSPVDVVFTDLGMPVTDGWELATALRARDASAVVIVVSGWGVQFSSETRREYGLFDLLAKPLSLDHAVSVARRAVLERRARLAVPPDSALAA